jgi:anti-sigma-K factor RskA
MVPNDEEDRDMLAAEYVLGTLSPEERAAVTAQLFRDGGLRRHVLDWERRLSPLGISAAEQSPPGNIEKRIMARLDNNVGSTGEIFMLRRRAALWRSASIVAGLLAASLAAVMIFEPLQRTPPENSYVAVLQPNGPGPAFVANIDIAKGLISVRRIGAEPQAGRSYELWAVGGDREKPRSLGVIEASTRIPVAKLGSLETGRLGNTVFAVSIEPPGGSPTGQPTGPVVFTGKLISVGD